MQTLQSPSSYYHQQQQIAAATTASAKKLWRRVTDDFDTYWGIRPQLLELVQAGRLAAATTSAAYTPTVLAESNQVAPAAGLIVPSAFVSSAPDGRDMGSLLDESVIRARLSVKAGSSAVAAREAAGSWLTGMLLTVMADTGRSVVGADIAQRPTLTGYVRMLNPPSCSRCVILAGKWFRWNQGFLRHPRCDCRHIPASESIAGDLTTDPYEYFNSLTREAQEKTFGRIEARAIRDGGDIYRVENLRLRGLGTAKGNLRYGTPSRLTVDDIYRSAGTRKNAIRMLTEEGYITGPQTAGGNILGNANTDARVLAAGRGQGTYVRGGQAFTTRRARVFDSVESGVRNPLDRATMTAAERRLFDAHYRLNYARTTGLMPRSVGASSADLSSRALRASADDMARLEQELQKEIAKLPDAPASVKRLADKLGVTASGAGGGRIPPRRRLGSGDYDPEPDDALSPEGMAYWKRRQDALNAGDIELMAPHEIKFYEDFQSAGYSFRLIPRAQRGEDGRTPSTADFEWLDRGIKVEIKSFDKPRQRNVSKEISSTVRAAVAHGVFKSTYIIYSRKYPPTEAFLEQMKDYNLRHPDAQIERLFWWASGELVEIDLRK